MNAKATSPTHGLGVVGISHRTAPLEVLEKLALAPREIAALYDRLSEDASVADAMILSTCNRTEVYLRTAVPLDPAPLVWSSLRDITGDERQPGPKYFYVEREQQSAAHLLKVACGLDSLILGEQQILGQVRAAFETSRDYRTPTPPFEQLCLSALRVARDIRRSTEIGSGAVSVASAGVHLATRIYSDLSRRTVMIVGAGETGRLAAEHFLKHAPGRLVILNRSAERGQKLAQAVGGEYLPLTRLVELLAQADICTTAVSLPEPVIRAIDVEAAMARRGGRPLALLDLGLPRNIDTMANRIANVFLHDMEALKRVVDANLARRRQEVPKVEQLIARELERLHQRQRELEAGPLIAALRHAVEATRAAEVDRATRGMTEAERQAVDRATRAVVNKLLHGPMTSIKDVARQQEKASERLGLIEKIFENLVGHTPNRDES